MTDKEKISILGIAASHRFKEGNSEKMLIQLFGHVCDYGGKSSIIRLVEKNILPCEACYSETLHGEKCIFPCIHDGKDDTMDVLNAISEADALVIATPVYWGGVPSSLQNLIEKMTSIENNAYQIYEKTGRNPLEGKPVVLISSQDGEGSSMALAHLAWALSHMGMLILPYGMIFKPTILNRKTVQFGLRLIGERKFEWIENTLAIAGRNLVKFTEKIRGYSFDETSVRESRS